MAPVPSEDATALPMVVVADDDAAVRLIVARALAAFGMSTVLVEDGAAAVEAVHLYAPRVACVILDVSMPVMDGITAGRRIQQGWHMPIIIMSGEAHDDHVAQLQQTGRVTFLAKPFGLTELRTSIQHTLAPQTLVAA